MVVLRTSEDVGVGGPCRPQVVDVQHAGLRPLHDAHVLQHLGVAKRHVRTLTHLQTGMQGSELECGGFICRPLCCLSAHLVGGDGEGHAAREVLAEVEDVDPRLWHVHGAGLHHLPAKRVDNRELAAASWTCSGRGLCECGLWGVGSVRE